MRRKRVHRGRSSRDQPEKVPTSGNGRDAAPAARAPVQDFQAPSQTPTCSPRSSSFKIRNGAKTGPGLYYRGTRVPVDRACVAQQHSCVVLNKHTATKLTFLVVAAMHLQMIASIQSCRPTCKPSRYAPCASDLTDLLHYYPNQLSMIVLIMHRTFTDSFVHLTACRSDCKTKPGLSRPHSARAINVHAGTGSPQHTSPGCALALS